MVVKFGVRLYQNFMKTLTFLSQLKHFLGKALKFAKYILRVKRNASHVAVRGDLGLYPILCRVLIAVCKNWKRIATKDLSSYVRKTYLHYLETMNSPVKSNYCHYTLEPECYEH